MGSGSFAQSTIRGLMMRAGGHCSNPDCFSITTGPNESNQDATVLGEAAHIYGNKPGAARYDENMTDSMRSDIANGIWLCRNCHKIIDDNPSLYPPKLLIIWKDLHEEKIMKSIGRAGDVIRLNYNRMVYKEFEEINYFSKQILLERGDFWEYKLTASLLNSLLSEVDFRWKSLRRGLYVRDVTILSDVDAVGWFNSKIFILKKLLSAIILLVEAELHRAWGDPGVPGNEIEILRVCRLISEAAIQLLKWEEDVRFIHVSENFLALYEKSSGMAGDFIEQILKIPEWLDNKLLDPNLNGHHELNLVFKIDEEKAESIINILRNIG